MSLYLVLDVVEIRRYCTLELANLILLQIVLGNAHVRLQNTSVRCILPCGQPHVILCVVSLGIDNLCRCLSCDSIVKAVLNHSVEVARGGRVFVVVRTALRIDVRNLLPDATLAGANRTNTFEQFTEVILSKYSSALLQTVIVHGKTLLDVFTQDFSCPLTKFSGFGRIDAIANCNNHVKMKEVNQLFNFTTNASIYDSCNFCNCRILLEFSCLENV